MGERYPTRREHFAWQGSLRLDSRGNLEADKHSGGPDGYIFVSPDGSRIFQARLDGFTLNKLRPYESWTSLRDEARELWEAYCQAVIPEVVTRLALRFINRIEMSPSVPDFKEYILTVPEVAPGLPQGLAGFLLRLMIPIEDYGCDAIVTETIQSPQNDLLPFILDIDVYREKSLDPRSGEIWETFEKLRHAKNKVFFESLTDKAKELFK